MDRITKYAPAVLIALCAFLVMQTVNSIKENKYIGGQGVPQNIITVSGEGEVFANPDIATFTFGVDETGKTVKEAQTKVTNKVNPSLKAIKALGVEDKDIVTTNFNAYPKYEYGQSACPMNSYCPPGKQILVGYEVSETITVKVRKIDDAGKVIDAATSAGATNVSSLSFTIDDQDGLNQQARQKAIAKAKTKAQTLASDLGVSLVRIVSFSENGGGYPVPMYMKADMAVGMGGVAESAPTLPAGQNKVSSNVTITYEIR
jgi:hypothetical protein